MRRAETSVLVGVLLAAAVVVAAERTPDQALAKERDEPRRAAEAGATSLARTPATGASFAGARDAAPASDAGETYAEVYARFGAALTRLRQGDLAAAVDLQASAETLARRFGRADAPRSAAYYVALAPADLAQGLRAEQEFTALWKEISAKNNAEISLADWDVLRTEAERDLTELAAQCAGRPDFVVGGRALSLLALLAIERVERDERLSAADEAALVQDAEARALESRRIFERAGFSTPQLEPLWTLGRIAFARHDARRTRETFEELHELATLTRRDDYRVKALRGLVWLAEDLGDVAEVDRLLGELARLEAPTEHWFTARKHAASLLSKDEPALAIEFLLRARPKGDLAEQEWHLLLGDAHLRRRDLGAARAEFEQLEPGTTRELALASLALREGDARGALDALSAPAFLDGLRRDRRAQALALAGEARLALGDPAGAVEALSAALELADDWRAHFEIKRETHDPVISVIGEVLGLHVVVLLAEAQARLGNPLEAARVIEAHQTLSLGARRGEAALRADVLRAWAAPYELGLVTWVVGADRSLVAHVAADGDAAAWPIDVGREGVASAVRRLREAAPLADGELFEQHARAIGERLLPPELRERLARPSGGDGRILCLLHGPLEELPIGALLMRAIGERVAPLVLPGLPASEPGAPERLDGARWFLLGDPLAADDGLLPVLPGARAELEQLARLHPGSTALRGGAFDRAAFELAWSEPRPLHVATHVVPGCFSRARLSGVGLVLSGGELLCPADVRRLAAPPPLVFLSACESQGGRFVDAEGLHGVARAFLEAGTRNLVVTLWPVEDGAARTFALAFHRAIEQGLLPSHAVQAARVELEQDGAGPADWAAFRLAGRD